MRTINVVFEIEDNDTIEYSFESQLRGVFGSSVKDYQIIPNTKELYENDSHFKKITKAYYDAKKVRNDYINEHNFKKS